MRGLSSRDIRAGELRRQRRQHAQGSQFRQRYSKLRLIIAAILAIAGIGVLSYPWLNNKVYESGIATQKQEFLEHTHGSYPQNPDDPIESQFEELYRYLQQENEHLAETEQASLVDAWSYQTMGVDLSQYGIEDSCIGFISLPRINIELPIYLGANTANMDKGAVHLTQTSYPIGGENTNSVIAAHRGQTRNMFRNIDQMQVGDEVIITNFREELVYQVVQIEIIYPYDIAKVKIQPGRDLVTLVSCHPVGTTYQRYIVYCERVEP